MSVFVFIDIKHSVMNAEIVANEANVKASILAIKDELLSFDVIAP